jgi:Fic family protein
MNVFLSQRFPGEIRKAGLYKYFLPADIFLAKNLVLNFKIQKQLEEATLVLGKFSAKITGIPNINHFISSYLNKEAVQSSRIEGTQTEIDQAFEEDESEVSADNKNDWQELRQYIVAINKAITNLNKLPICSRLIQDTHKILLSQVRGEHKSPGAYRESQNWIGGSRPDNAHFVPPAPEFVEELMKNLEYFIHDDSLQIPNLVKIALIHYQFETIHPFLDGNGRIGRMLIPLYLLEKKMLDQPILYISDFFEKNRRSYYDALDYARKDEEGVIRWISFFLDGVISTANEGIEITEKILKLREKIFQEKIPTLGRRAKNGQKLVVFLFKTPIVDSIKIREELKISAQSSQILINDFVKLGILQEITGQKRNRMFVFEDYLALLRK